MRHLATILLALILGPFLFAANGSTGGPMTATEANTEDSSAAMLFERANDAYRRGAYDEAELTWRALLEDPSLVETDRARIAMNIGNAAWRTDRAMEAVGWYTIAVKLDARNADARANLELARAESGLEPSDRGDLRSTVGRLLNAPRPAERRWAVLGAALLLACALIGEALRGGATWRRSAAFLALVFALVCVPWIYGMQDRTVDSMLVLARPQASLRSEPRASLPAIGEVRAGDEVERIDELSDWVRVRTHGGQLGWLRSEAVFSLR